MKRKYTLFLLIGIIVLLAGVICWLAHYKSVGMQPSLIKQIESGRIVSVTLSKENTSFTVTRKKAAFTTTNFQNIDIVVDVSACNTLFESIAQISYSEILSDTLNKKNDFGLTSPTVCVTATLDDNTSYTLYIGDDFFTGTGVYFYLSDRNKIYGTSDTAAFQVFTYSEEDFFEQVLFPETKGSAIANLTAVNWTKENTKHTIVTVQKNNTLQYFLQHPTQLKLNTESTQDMLHPLLQLSATKIYKPKLTKAQKKNLGFSGDNVRFIIKGHSYSFEIGNKTALGYYVLTPNGVCYIVPSTALKFIEHQFI